MRISPRTPPQNRLYSLKEAGEAWGISQSTLDRHIRDGHVPVVRMGRLRKIEAPVFERVSRDGLPPNGRGKKPRRRT